MNDSYTISLIIGTANQGLGEDIANRLKIKPINRKIATFADGELNIKILDNMRGADAFIIQPTSPDVNKNLMELLLLIHTLNLSSSKRITAVVPYFGYARQDRKIQPRVPISASAVAQLIEAMRPHRLVTVDLHSGQIQGFFHLIPVDNLTAEKEFVGYLKKRFKTIDPSKLAVVSPDAGGVTRAQSIADNLHIHTVVTIIKRRIEANQIESMQIVGNVDGLICIIVDDIIDTAGTLTKAASVLKEKGAVKVYACATHGVFSGPAMERIQSSCLEEVCVTDSIPQQENAKKCSKLKVVSLSPLLAKAIQRIHDEQSISVLFSPEAKSVTEEVEEETKTS